MRFNLVVHAHIRAAHWHQSSIQNFLLFFFLNLISRTNRANTCNALRSAKSVVLSTVWLWFCSFLSQLCSSTNLNITIRLIANIIVTIFFLLWVIQQAKQCLITLSPLKKWRHLKRVSQLNNVFHFCLSSEYPLYLSFQTIVACLFIQILKNLIKSFLQFSFVWQTKLFFWKN